MNYSNSWYDYLTRVQLYMKQQDKKIRDLEQRIAYLETNQSNPNQTTIENLEYHFDQLKIERLDGTLHIGLSPDDLSKVDDMSISQPQMNNHQQQTRPLQQQLVGQLDTYLVEKGPDLLHQLSTEYGFPLNQSNQEMILNDVRKQLPERVAHYHKNARSDQTGQRESELTQFIYEQVQKEIHHSLRQFFQNDQLKGDN